MGRMWGRRKGTVGGGGRCMVGAGRGVGGGVRRGEVKVKRRGLQRGMQPS
jgi:hypothetical protein